MRVIVIESTVYKITEMQFKKLTAYQKEIFKHGYHSECEMDMNNFLEKNKPKYKIVGDVEFDFRL